MYFYNLSIHLSLQCRNRVEPRDGNYETFYRQYDAAIGRFTAVDIMVNKYPSVTPYNYCFNDPVSYNDPMGDDAWADMQAWANGVMAENRSFIENDGIGANNYYGYGNNFGAGYGMSSANRTSGYARGADYSMSSLNSFASEVSMKRFLKEHVKSVVLGYDMYSGTSSGGGSVTLGTELVVGKWTNHWGDSDVQEEKLTGNLILFVHENAPYGNNLVGSGWNARSISNMHQAKKYVSDYAKKKSINNLVIIAHAGTHGIRMGLTEGSDVTVSDMATDSFNARLLKDITDNVSSGGNLVFNACEAGQNTIYMANKYLNTDRGGLINIYMNQDKSLLYEVKSKSGKKYPKVPIGKNLTLEEKHSRGWLHISGSTQNSYMNMRINKNGSITPIPWF
ncbi:hypothetical protein LVD17_27250 [Fulvivirga ulvae]|uniref:RHS repeat-associated core domain-containing protein n=1 Tax=Fulvivirga ulvae TaxID=2904245 RepID=UPI001F1B32C3|nr:RHS repeat-associated core domain-containing protein [Fulvivirga ulvae]UII31989.1 hypothetical protein LVD17_27250 [Fulvivirga ulvae]